jgi:hypothetical protein
MKSFRDIRVIPVVLVAIFGLAVLKVAGLVVDGGYVCDYQPNATKKSWAQDAFNFPGGPKGNPDDITGSALEKPKEPAPKPAAPAAEAPKPDGVVVYPDPQSAVGVAVRARHPRAAAGAAAGTGAARA